MAYKVVPDRQGIIQIGKIKENLVTEVELPAPGFEGGSYAVLLRRPKEEQPYPVTARHEGSTLIWTVQTADTAIAGTGKLECRWYGDKGEVAKSQTYMVRITDGLPDPTKAPEAWEGFMGQVARNAQAAKTAAGEAKANADGAAASAGIAQGAAADAGKLAGAAGDAANAAAAAASAASSAQTGAETARQNARAAAEAAETARSGAEAAKLAAGESAGSAEKAAQAAEKGEKLYNQVKDDLAAGKMKGEKGDKGDPGKDAPQIDDGVVSDAAPWSSKKIVETLCPPISETGNPVTCYLVAGYPLGVVASWEPIQAGTGDPSPENIRPISGREAVSVERCGVNLLDEARFPIIKTKNNIKTTSEMTLPAGTYTVCVLSVANGVYAYGADVEYTYDSNKHTFDLARRTAIMLNAYWTKGRPEKDENIWLVEGNERRPYIPYIGQTNTLTLPETVYGGEVDAVSGAGKETWRFIALDGTEDWKQLRDYCETSFRDSGIPSSKDDITAARLSQHADRYIIDNPYANTTADKCAWVYSTALHPYANLRIKHKAEQSTLEIWKAYLAAQYAAGTPVQVAYKLAEPVPFQATGNGPIMPLEGEANTVMTDADSVTVTGRADPIRIIQQLQAAQSVATEQLAETQQAVVDTTAMAVDYIYQQDLEDIGLEEVAEDDNQTDTEPVDVPGV